MYMRMYHCPTLWQLKLSFTTSNKWRTFRSSQGRLGPKRQGQAGGPCWMFSCLALKKKTVSVKGTRPFSNFFQRFFRGSTLFRRGILLCCNLPRIPLNPNLGQLSVFFNWEKPKGDIWNTKSWPVSSYLGTLLLRLKEKLPISIDCFT